MRSKFVIGTVLGLFVLLTWLLGHLYGLLLTTYEQMPALKDLEYSWIFRLLLNLVGYSTVILPFYGLYKYLEKTNYFDKISNTSCVSRWLHALFCEQERLPEPGRAAGGGAGDSRTRDGLEFAFCFTGLMGAYLVWGLFASSPGNHFPSGLRDVGRVGVSLHGLSVPGVHQPSAGVPDSAGAAVGHSPPCAGRAAVQVLVLRAVQRRQRLVPVRGAQVRQLPDAGRFLLACDGFTSSWQGALFRRHSLRPLQMLCCVSLCSCALTAAALLRRPAPALLSHPAFLADAALLAASSAAGQLLIYRTIARFGPALFAMAMTARQAASVLLSCAVYGHRVPPPAAAGALLVFAAVLLRLHFRRTN